jgi:hypothetical protein
MLFEDTAGDQHDGFLSVKRPDLLRVHFLDVVDLAKPVRGENGDE